MNVTSDTKCAFSDAFLMVRSKSFQIDNQLHELSSKSMELNRKSGRFWLMHWIFIVAQNILQCLLKSYK